MTNDTGTDARRFNFFMIDNEVVDNYDLNPQEGWLYIAIVRYVNQQTGIAFPSLATLAEKTNMSVPTVVKYLKTLQEKRLINITGQYDPVTKAHKSNHYILRGVVKEVNKGCKPALQGVVKEVNTKNTKVKKTKEEDSTDPNRSDAPEEKSKRKRSEKQLALDGIKDALADAFGLRHALVTPTKWNEFGRAGKELLAVGATPEEMTPLFKWCAAQDWPGFSSIAMAKHYADFKKEQTPVEDTTPKRTFIYIPGCTACNDGMVVAAGKSMQCPECRTLSLKEDVRLGALA